MLAALAALRIVSLAPSLTEDLFAIGAGPHVVAVDEYSNRPTAAARLPKIGALREANAERILALRPDLVVGVSYQAPVLADLARAGLHVATLDVDDLAGDLHAIDRLGELTGNRSQAQALHHTIDTELRAVAMREARRRERSAFVVIGRTPLYTAGPGSYIDDLLRLAHLRNVVTVAAPWPSYSGETLLAQQPDVLVVTANEPPLIGPPWERLDAVRDAHVVRIAEDDLLRPGPHVAAVLRALCAQVDRWR